MYQGKSLFFGHIAACQFSLISGPLNKADGVATAQLSRAATPRNIRRKVAWHSKCKLPAMPLREQLNKKY